MRRFQTLRGNTITKSTRRQLLGLRGNSRRLIDGTNGVDNDTREIADLQNFRPYKDTVINIQMYVNTDGRPSTPSEWDNVSTMTGALKIVYYDPSSEDGASGHTGEKIPYEVYDQSYFTYNPGSGGMIEQYGLIGEFTMNRMTDMNIKHKDTALFLGVLAALLLIPGVWSKVSEQDSPWSRQRHKK